MRDFFEDCYRALKLVPRGKVTTYKEIAEFLNSKAYRAVGNAMNKNTNAPRVPCHRVVGSDGRMCGYNSGIAKKIKLLKKEGISVVNGKVVNLESKLHTFKREVKRKA